MNEEMNALVYRNIGIWSLLSRVWWLLVAFGSIPWSIARMGM